MNLDGANEVITALLIDETGQVTDTTAELTNTLLTGISN